MHVTSFGSSNVTCSITQELTPNDHRLKGRSIRGKVLYSLQLFLLLTDILFLFLFLLSFVFVAVFFTENRK